ncbi:hypothetical protein KV697_17770 [Sphingomonas sanguinis]|uniref:hypothetical protein n=1 Tax=Sphingomonas sanguinis TaxID=33051 RepID=UPI001C59990F|nr:hypothetical protein [Sphingomonas sanguinis]QXT35549.1 hypothetical protein KV697_17770 [Sphingomonas sanguinis]
MTAHKMMSEVAPSTDVRDAALDAIEAGADVRLVVDQPEPPVPFDERAVQLLSRLAGPIALGVGVAVVASLIWG